MEYSGFFTLEIQLDTRISDRFPTGEEREFLRMIRAAIREGGERSKTRTESGCLIHFKDEKGSKVAAMLRAMGYNAREAGMHSIEFFDSTDIICIEDIELTKSRNQFQENLIHVRKTDSTNLQLSLLARDGAPHGTVILADEQTGGRGRLGRSWHSPAGVGLWFSILLRCDLPVFAGGRITMLAAGSIAASIRKMTGLQAVLRWPNDLFLDGKKLCGVLSEGEISDERLKAVVFGAGLNVNQLKTDFPDELKDVAVSLRMGSGAPMDRAILFGEILEGLGRDFRPGWEDGERGRELWESLSDLEGTVVEVGDTRGTVLGVDRDGALMLQKNTGETCRISSGDLRVLPR